MACHLIFIIRRSLVGDSYRKVSMGARGALSLFSMFRRRYYEPISFFLQLCMHVMPPLWNGASTSCQTLESTQTLQNFRNFVFELCISDGNIKSALQEKQPFSAPEDTSAKESSANDTECDDDKSCTCSTMVPSTRVCSKIFCLDWHQK